MRDDNCGCGLHGASRRDLLRWGAATAGFLAMGPFRGVLPNAAGAPLPLKRLVIVNLIGGNDTLNTFIPVTLAPYFARRGALAIPEATAISLNGGPAATTRYRMNPFLPKIADLYKEGKVAAVQKVGYPNENLSHFESMDIFSLGVRNGFEGLGLPRTGWIARYAGLYAPTPMGAVSIGAGRPLDFDGATTSPVIVNELDTFKLNDDFGATDELYRLEQSKQLLANYQGSGLRLEAKRAAFVGYEISDQVQTAVAAYTSTVNYGTSYIAQRLRDVAILIKGGFETRVFYTGFGNFDHHSAQGTDLNFGNHAKLLVQLDDAVGGLAEDLKSMGAWNDTVIAIITEFGRRNYSNASSGTDHGHGFCELLVGGKVKGGVLGSDLVDADLNSEYLAYDIDFRSIYKEAISQHLGGDPDPVFPEALEKSTQANFI